MPVVKSIVCDCCGKEVQGTYYLLQVWADDTRGGVTAEMAGQNMVTNLSRDKTYCPDCISRIRKEFNF